MLVSDLLERTCTVGGSDLHLAAGLPPRIRLHGELEAVAGCTALGDAELRPGLRAMVSAELRWAASVAALKAFDSSPLPRKRRPGVSAGRFTHRVYAHTARGSKRSREEALGFSRRAPAS